MCVSVRSWLGWDFCLRNDLITGDESLGCKMSTVRVTLMSCPPSKPFFSTKLAHRQHTQRLINLVVVKYLVVNVTQWWWLQLTWVEDGTRAALVGPGLWVQSDAAPPDLHPRVLVEDFLDFDLHFRVGAFIVRWHHFYHQHCRKIIRKW